MYSVSTMYPLTKKKKNFFSVALLTICDTMLALITVYTGKL